jgi:hypothetical protein
MAERAAKLGKTATDEDVTKVDGPLETTHTSLSIPAKGLLTPSSTLQSSESPSRTKYTRADLVTLLVGPEEQELLAFGHQLSENSDFFKSALKKEWADGQTRTIRLPEDETQTVEQYLDFVRSQVLPTKTIELANHLRDTDSYVTIFRLYTFGERVLNTSIRNAVIEETLRLRDILDGDSMCWLPSDDSVEVIYEGTPEGSAVRRLLVDIQVAHGYRQALDSGDLNLAYLSDLARSYSERVEKGELSTGFPRITLEAADYLL